MRNFYDEWLRYWDDIREEKARARKCIQPEEQEWVRTKQDHRAALLLSPQTGFFTGGTVTVADIPRNWNTGKHSHGEEAIYIVEGQGFSVIDDRRYDWDTGSCVFVPFGAVHQHFNSGDSTVRYLSAMALPLERFAGLARIVQYEEACETPMGQRDAFQRAESDIHPEYGRIILQSKDIQETPGTEWARRRSKWKDEYTTSVATEMRSTSSTAHREAIIPLMHPESGFKTREVAFTAILLDKPGTNSGKHAHMEAVLYALQGEGYTTADGEKVHWKKGALIQVQGPQTVHQHFNTGDVPSKLLRVHFGLRSHFFQAITTRVFPYLYFAHGIHGD
ncbi:MAG: cupin domain-containing protein [Chloroflexi bacterium]|nr:cupin domain-containing protein [Chloroflexota bacterium]